MSDPSRSAALDRWDRRLAVLLALVALLVYNANLRSPAAGDSAAARFIPFAVWGDRTVYLDPVFEPMIQGHPDTSRLRDTVNGHKASTDPIVPPLLVTPLYLPAALDLFLHNWTAARMVRLALIMDKVSASIVASLAVGWMYLLLRRRLGRPDALLLTVLFAFGTSTWSTSSQALGPHGPAELFCVAALWFLTGPPTAWHALAAGLATGLLVANHPPDLPLALAFGVAALFWAGRRAALYAAFVLAAVLPPALTAVYNEATFGRLSTSAFFPPPSLEGCAGLLTDSLPVLAWMLAPALPALGRVSRVAFAVAGVLAICVQMVGAFSSPGANVYRAWRELGKPALPPPPPRAGPASDFYTVVPCRLLDTRSGTPLESERPRRFQIAGAGCGIPASAVAVACNATTLAESGEGLVLVRSDLGLGQLEMRYAADGPRSLQILLPLAPDGSIHLAAQGRGRAQLVLDVSGYFAPVSPGQPVRSSAPPR